MDDKYQLLLTFLVGIGIVLTYAKAYAKDVREIIDTFSKNAFVYSSGS